MIQHSEAVAKSRPELTYFKFHSITWNYYVPLTILELVLLKSVSFGYNNSGQEKFRYHQGTQPAAMLRTEIEGRRNTLMASCEVVKYILQVGLY